MNNNTDHSVQSIVSTIKCSKLHTLYTYSCTRLQSIVYESLIEAKIVERYLSMSTTELQQRKYIVYMLSMAVNQDSWGMFNW